MRSAATCSSSAVRAAARCSVAIRARASRKSDGSQRDWKTSSVKSESCPPRSSAMSLLPHPIRRCPGRHDADDEARRHRRFFRAAALRRLKPAGPALHHSPDPGAHRPTRRRRSACAWTGAAGESRRSSCSSKRRGMLKLRGKRPVGGPVSSGSSEGGRTRRRTDDGTLLIAKKRRVVRNVENRLQPLGQGIGVAGQLSRTRSARSFGYLRSTSTTPSSSSPFVPDAR